MKKSLSIAMMALAFTACQKDDAYSPEEKGELQTSYISISLASADMGTRSTDANDYHDGESAERAVNSVYIFFFDESGDAFVLPNNDDKNYKQLSFEFEPESGSANISDVSNSVLVIQNYKGELPTQMVAVLNWPPTETTYSIDALKAAIVGTMIPVTVEENTVNYFIMSNSVYKDATGKAAYATPLEITDFKNSEEAAEGAPVEVYVERVAAKVTLTAPGDVSGKENTYKLNGSTGLYVGQEAIYAKVLGWDIYNDQTESYLLKHIDATWTDDGLGFSWNNSPWYRSYWAESYAQTLTDDINYESTQTVGTSLYCCENTTSTDANRTKIFIKAQLQDAEGNAVTIAQWLGNNYDGMENLMKAVKNTISNTYYYLEGDQYLSITTADLRVVKGNGTPAQVYEVYFQLSQEDGVGENRQFYVKNADGTAMEEIDTEDLNTALATITPARVYTEGQTYYHTTVRHLAAKDSSKPGEFGVVRNHIYQINITKIAGFGTPVFDKNDIIDVPMTPIDIETFVAAEINILSWRLVDYNIEL